MPSLIRGLAIYLFLLLVFRIAGKRTLSDVSTFDFVLLLIISESVQQALIGDDYSLTNAFLLTMTLVGLNIVMSVLKREFPRLERVLEAKPQVIFDQGEERQEAMKKERVDIHDIMHSARQHQGVADLDDVEMAILEPSGGISVIPKGG